MTCDCPDDIILLAVLELYASGWEPAAIAVAVGLSTTEIVLILDDDKAAFPEEPLRRVLQ